MEILQIFMEGLPWIAAAAIAGIGGWVFTTWLRIKNGYPLSSSWGLPMHPTTDRDSAERIKLLTTENAQLRAEMGAIKDRLENIERIVTDQPSQLSREIEALTGDRTIDKGGRA